MEINTEEVFKGSWVSNKKLPRAFNKSNALVARKYQTSLTVTQQKLINVLFHKAMSSDHIKGMPTYWATSLKDVFGYVEVNSRNYKDLEKTVKQLKTVELNLKLGDDDYEFITVFPTFRIKKGIVAFEINAAILDRLKVKNPYTRILVEELKPLSRACSVGIYELASRYAKMKSTPWMPWEELRDKIYTGVNNLPKYTLNWGEFNKWYVKPAIEDVNANTRYNVTVETVKASRSVSEVRLVINVIAPVSSINDASKRQGAAGILSEQLTKWDIDKKTQDGIFINNSLEVISLAIAHTRLRLQDTKADPVKSPSSYFYRSMSKKYYETSLRKGLICVPDYVIAELSQNNQSPAQAVTESSSNTTVIDMRRKKLYDLITQNRVGRVKIILNEISVNELADLYEEYNSNISSTALKMFSQKKNKVGAITMFHKWYSIKLWGELNDENAFKELMHIDSQTLLNI